MIKYSNSQMHKEDHYDPHRTESHATHYRGDKPLRDNVTIVRQPFWTAPAHYAIYSHKLHPYGEGGINRLIEQGRIDDAGRSATRLMTLLRPDE